MDFALSPAAEDACDRMWDFMREGVLPAEPVYEQWRRRARRARPSARRRGAQGRGAAARPVEPVPAAAVRAVEPRVRAASPRSPAGRRSSRPRRSTARHRTPATWRRCTCSATEEQKQQWLEPLLDGTIRSAFAMTEPDVASSDATNIATRIERRRRRLRHQRPQVVDQRRGRRALPDCLIVMGKTDPDARPHRQQSMILVPRDAPGMTRSCGTCRSSATRTSTATPRSCFDDVRVPAANLLAEEGDGFMIAQARLGPGRIHHAMRAIGMAERALALMVGAGQDTGGVRQAAGRPGRRAGPRSPSRGSRSSRPGCSCSRPRG